MLTSVDSDRVIHYDKVEFRPAVNKRVRAATVARWAALSSYGPNGTTQDADPQAGYDDLLEGFGEPYSSSTDLPVNLTFKGGVVTRIDGASLLAG